jgi:hypothetical protein
VVFADVVGSTALGEGVDPETLRWAMQRWFERMVDAIERHGGTVENLIGDAVMGVFGIPVVHEDDALRAVRAAAEMREEVAVLRGELRRERGVELGVRIGVNTGEAVTAASASGVGCSIRSIKRSPTAHVTSSPSWARRGSASHVSWPRSWRRSMARRPSRWGAVCPMAMG